MDYEDLVAKYGGVRLDIGCGENKREGWVGMDVRDMEGVDIVHNVEDFPWPLPDEGVLVAVCSHLVEHINPHGGVFIRFMDEAWRVMRPGGQLAIVTPHYRSPGWAQDPTHCAAFNQGTWGYFDPEEQLYQIYKPKPWKIEHLSWNPNGNIEVVLRKREI